jgi:hypothetical protein
MNCVFVMTRSLRQLSARRPKRSLDGAAQGNQIDGTQKFDRVS